MSISMAWAFFAQATRSPLYLQCLLSALLALQFYSWIGAGRGSLSFSPPSWTRAPRHSKKFLYSHVTIQGSGPAYRGNH
ncbi:hypothetical protein B0H11DRAFT_2039133 [Mycena galericulata]|nr:hypothetical protein B0H11DRAFT_2039133 [Mycena galericulata]